MVALFSLLSAFLGIALLSSVIVINAPVLRKGWLGDVPTEVRYVALFALILLVALNGNQWMAGNLLFPFISIAAITSVLISLRKLTDSDRRNALHDGMSLLAVQAFTLVAVFFVFQMHRYWLLEGSNHDSLYFYEGLHWALASPLFVSKEEVRALWDLGVCGAGSWIGYDCPLYRGGTYTVAAWTQYFAPSFTGNALHFIAVYGATMAWLACRLIITTSVRRWIIALLALPVAFSTGIIGALVNANLGTVLGAACFVPIIALALRTDLLPGVRFGLMAAWCAVAAHVYAESVFYAGLFIGLVFLLELPRHYCLLRLGGVSRLAMLLLLIVFGLGNIAVMQAFATLFFFVETVKGGEWFSWYIQQQPLLWVGSFIAGLLIGAGKPLIPVVVVASVITLFSGGTLLSSRQTRAGTLALIGTSCLAVLYVEFTGFQYGEHKIVHLLGPAWALAVVFAGARLLGWAGVDDFARLSLPMLKAGGVIILFCVALISASFFVRSGVLLNSLRVLHSVDFGLPVVASYVRPGETVLVDDTAWFNIEKFQKTHYLVFQLHHQGATALLPSISSDALRGGYFHANRHDTLSRAKGVDWLVQSRSRSIPNSKFVPPDIAPIWENVDFSLYRIGKKSVAVAGNGWYDCEPTHCWTVAPFEIEAYVPAGGNFELSVNFSVFRPPEAGTITVRSGDGQVLATARSSSEQLRIDLPQGWSRLVFDSDWSITSPLDVGLSADQRKLFAAIRRVELKPLQGLTDK